MRELSLRNRAEKEARAILRNLALGRLGSVLLAATLVQLKMNEVLKIPPWRQTLRAILRKKEKRVRKESAAMEGSSVPRSSSTEPRSLLEAEA
jgi:hypothetical protein